MQSPVKDSAGLELATRAFLQDFVANWSDTDAAEFAQQKAGLINRLTEPPKNLNEHSRRYWADLSRGYLTFDSRQQTAALVDALTVEDMQQFFSELLQQLDSRRLIIYTQGKFDDVPADGTLLESPVADWS